MWYQPDTLQRLSAKENLYNSRVPELGNYAYLYCESLWDFYSCVELTIIP